MEDEKKQEELMGLGKKLAGFLNNLLSVGDWESSLFLKTSKVKFETLRGKIEAFYTEDSSEVGQESSALGRDKRKVQEGFVRMFVLLYQMDGSNMQIWFGSVRSLSDYSVNRPAYEKEQDVQETVRSKESSIENSGYVVVDIKEDDIFWNFDQVDQLGHKLLGLKEGALKLENIIEFIHANKRRYWLGENELEFLGEI